MYRICIVDFSRHSEVVNAFTLALTSASVKVTLFIHASIANDIPEWLHHDMVTVVVKPKESHFHSFLNTNIAALKKCDAVFCTTQYDNDSGEYIRYNWPMRSYLLLHDLYSTFEPLLHFKANSTKDYLRLFRFILMRKHSDMGQSLAAFQYFTVPNEKMASLMQEKSEWSRLGSRKLKGISPMATAHFQPPIHERDYCHIVVPGSISNATRNLDTLLQACRLLLQNYSDIPWKLTMLGKPVDSAGNLFIEQMEALVQPHFTFTYFDHYVDQPSYDATMLDADFILLPFQIHKQVGFVQEQLGISAVSGNINDMVRFGLPAILPSFYPLSERWQPNVATYQDSTELAHIMAEWISTKKYNDIKAENESCFAQDQAERVGEALKAVFFG